MENSPSTFYRAFPVLKLSSSFTRSQEIMVAPVPEPMSYYYWFVLKEGISVIPQKKKKKEGRQEEEKVDKQGVTLSAGEVQPDVSLKLNLDW